MDNSQKVTLNHRGRGGGCCREWILINILAIAENRKTTKRVARV